MKIEHEVDEKMREEYLKIASKVIYALGEIDKDLNRDEEKENA